MTTMTFPKQMPKFTMPNVSMQSMMPSKQSKQYAAAKLRDLSSGLSSGFSGALRMGGAGTARARQYLRTVKIPAHDSIAWALIILNLVAIFFLNTLFTVKTSKYLTGLDEQGHPFSEKPENLACLSDELGTNEVEEAIQHIERIEYPACNGILCLMVLFIMVWVKRGCRADDKMTVPMFVLMLIASISMWGFSGSALDLLRKKIIKKPSDDCVSHLRRLQTPFGIVLLIGLATFGLAVTMLVKASKPAVPVVVQAPVPPQGVVLNAQGQPQVISSPQAAAAGLV
jgi:hypothetical protein